MPGRAKSAADIKAFAESSGVCCLLFGSNGALGFIGWWEVSAKKDLNINESLLCVFRRVVFHV